MSKTRIPNHARDAWQYISEHPACSLQEMADSIGISLSQAYSIRSFLIAAGYVAQPPYDKAARTSIATIPLVSGIVRKVQRAP
jgi:hypothetical protein